MELSTLSEKLSVLTAAELSKTRHRKPARPACQRKLEGALAALQTATKLLAQVEAYDSKSPLSKT